MKSNLIIFYFLIIPTIAQCSITRERDWTWIIICNSKLIVRVHASSSYTHFKMQQGTLSDRTNQHENLLTLVASGIAQNIKEQKISKDRTAFLVPTIYPRHFALVYDPKNPTIIEYFDINQPGKIFLSDPEEVQELKKIINPAHYLQK